MTAPARPGLRLYRFRRLPVPTFPGWILLGILGIALLRFALPGLHAFLAVSRPIGSDRLVVEGWADDDALSAVRTLFEGSAYRYVYTTGGPIPSGRRLTDHADLAAFTAARLAAEGIPPERIVPVPADGVERDRTLASARALRRRIEAEGEIPTGIDILTAGTHARRTWILFRRELGDLCPVGILSVAATDYEPGAWWRSSQGFRTVVYEGLAYLYTRLGAGTCTPADDRR